MLELGSGLRLGFELAFNLGLVLSVRFKGSIEFILLTNSLS